MDMNVSLESWERGEGIEFVDEDAEADYKARASRLADAIRGDTPDRVPSVLGATFYPVYHVGYKPKEAMHDASKLGEALAETVYDLEPDGQQATTALIPSAKLLDILDYKLYAWPGDGAPEDHGYQALEDEYMGPDEYDHLIRDPTDFWLRSYMPEIFGALEPFRQLPTFTDIVEIPNAHFFALPFGMPEIQESLETLMEAGEEALRWEQEVGQYVNEIVTNGYPPSFGGFSKAPYDVLADTLRGTRGASMDLKRQPDTLMEGIDRITPIMTNMGIVSAQMSGNPLVFIPLHKGADGFMSEEEFETFYWPPLRSVLEGLVEANLVPWVFAEGSYDGRLESITDMPDGDIVWHFDQTDMVDAKDTIGHKAAVAGNVHSSLLNTKEPEDVDAYCQELINDVGPDGFILAPGVAIDEAKPENVRAMIDAPKP